MAVHAGKQSRFNGKASLAWSLLQAQTQPSPGWRAASLRSARGMWLGLIVAKQHSDQMLTCPRGHADRALPDRPSRYPVLGAGEGQTFQGGQHSCHSGGLWRMEGGETVMVEAGWVCGQKELCVKCGGGMVFGVESGVALKCRAYGRSGRGEGPGRHMEAPGLVPWALRRENAGIHSAAVQGRGTSVLSISCAPGPRLHAGAGQPWGVTALVPAQGGCGTGKAGSFAVLWMLGCSATGRGQGVLLVGMDFAQRPIPCVGMCFQCPTGWRRIY